MFIKRLRMKDIIIILIVAVIIGLVCFYIYRAKKKGTKCIGCPYGSSCQSKKDGSCGNGQK